MSRADRQRLRAIVACLALIGLGSSSFAADPKVNRQDYGPDPASVRRFGPAYRYPKDGWIVLHVEGEPYDRGYQHGRLLASEIGDYIKALAAQRSSSNPSEGWRSARTLTDALFLRRYDKEYLEEMKGTADGASAAGATFDGRAIDLLDVVAINSDIEVGCLDNALEASAHGLEGKVFQEPSVGKPKAPHVEHCSAFAAVGPATVDGKVVIGHITMWSLSTSRFFNVWLDVKPSQGHRVVMQTYPGGIQSGMDYYLNDAGLIVTETTIGQTRFHPEGQALASRIRKALQYGDSIDSVVEILSKRNNGLYSNEWLLADTKTNEIAMFELGTHKNKLWRSSKKEWYGGTEGFYWGCNNAKDVEVRLETVASVEAKPVNLVWRPSDRDRMWLTLFNECKGKINADFGFKAFTTPPLASSSSLDAKFTTSAMAKDLKTWALFGPPMGRTWEPGEYERSIAGIKPLVSNDWTTLTGEAPPNPPDGSKTAIDLTGAPYHPEHSGHEVYSPAWHGTILPRNDADTWLAAGFADYEGIVSFEKSLGEEAKEGAGRERVDLELYGPRSRYLTATRRLGKDVPLSKIQSEPASSDWYEIAAGKGVLLLAALREKMGHAGFAAMMDEFGRSHAGHPVETAQFRAHAEKASAGKPLKDFFDLWLDQTGLPDDPDVGVWAVDSYEWEPEKALIVYGTVKDFHANSEAARRLQRSVATRWSNIIVPIKSDTEVTEDDWKTHHILLVGRPETNAAVARASKTLPAVFGPASFTIKGETYAHPGTAVIVAGDNPLSPRFAVVLFAGLSAEATWHCVEHVGGRQAQAVVLADGGSPHRLVARVAEDDE
jgi:Phospholipase B